MKYILSIIIIVLSCIQGIGSLAIAQEATVQLNDQQEASFEAQTEEKDVPVITNPIVFDEKDLNKLLEKQREYVEKHYPNYRIKLKGEEHDVMDGHRYSFFDLENEDEEWVITIRFDIEDAHQAYMKKHQKEIAREAAKLIKQGIIKIE